MSRFLCDLEAKGCLGCSVPSAERVLLKGPEASKPHSYRDTVYIAHTELIACQLTGIENEGFLTNLSVNTFHDAMKLQK